MISEITNEIKFLYFRRQGKILLNSYLRVMDALGIDASNREEILRGEKECKIVKRYRKLAVLFRKKALNIRQVLRHGGMFD